VIHSGMTEQHGVVGRRPASARRQRSFLLRCGAAAALTFLSAVLPQDDDGWSVSAVPDDYRVEKAAQVGTCLHFCVPGMHDTATHENSHPATEYSCSDTTCCERQRRLARATCCTPR